MRLVEYEESICGCGCGQPLTIARDKTQAFKVDTFTCHAGKAKEQVVRKWREAHREAPEGWSEGIHHYVVPIDLDDEPDLRREPRRGH